MGIELITEAPFWFSLLCIGLGVLYATLLYSRSERLSELSKVTISLLAIIRAIVVAFIAFFLLTPLLKTLVIEKEKPILLVTIDNSESILIGVDSLKLNDLSQKVEALNNDNNSKFEVKVISFGEAVSETDNVLSYNEKYTNYNPLADHIENNYSNRNLGAIVVVSDGIYNQGNNPLYSFKKINAPIYTIGVGDTIVYRDAGIKKVNNNSFAYLGNKFPVEINLFAYKCMNEQLKVTISGKEGIIQSQIIEVTNDNFFTTTNFLLEAKTAGVQKYSIAIDKLANEKSITNNNVDIYIDIIENRERILLLVESPHPDIAAIRNALSQKDNYSIDVRLLSDAPDDFTKYNLVVLQQLSSNNKNVYTAILNKLENKKTPVLYLLTAKSDLTYFNEKNKLIRFDDINNKQIESLPKLNKDFNLFTFNNKIAQFIDKLPPLIISFARSYSFKGQGQSLITQKIGAVQTDKPLIVFGNNNDHKQGIILGEGIWKWRMLDYKLNGNHQLFDEMTQKMVQLLAAKDDKSKFRIICDNSFNENQEVEFKAELYDDIYELVTDAEVSLTISNENEEDYNYTFMKTGNIYNLNAGVFPEGNYTYEAKVTRNDTKYVKNGRFTIKTIAVEQMNTVADFSLLRQLSFEHQATFNKVSNWDKTIKSIENRDDISSIAYSYEQLQDLINLKWIFYLLISLLAIEWFIRKRNGAY